VFFGLSSLNPQLNKTALRLTVNPFGPQARHFPYVAAGAATQRNTLLRFGRTIPSKLDYSSLDLQYL